NHQDRDGDVSLDHGREAMLSIEERSVVGELDRLAGQLPSPGRHVTGVLAYLRRSDVPVAGVGLQPQAGRLRVDLFDPGIWRRVFGQHEVTSGRRLGSWASPLCVRAPAAAPPK